jgi:tape measure domain-containing protein
LALGISFRISAIDDFSNTMSKLENKTKKAFDTAGTIGKGMAGVGAISTATSGAVLGVGLNYLASMEKAEVGLETLTGSADKTKDVMNDLQNFALKTPFEFDGMLRGTRRLIGMGMGADQATTMLKATSDAVAAAGGGSAELDGVITALGQIQAKGKISAEEMNQLAERGIPGWKILSEVMNKPTSELMDMAANGKLLAKDGLPALQKGFEKTFGGAAAEQSATFSGRLSNIKEQFQILAGALAKPLFEPLSNAMGKVVEKAQKFSEWFQKLPKGVQSFITVSIIVAPILLAIAGGMLILLALLPGIIGGFTTIAGAVGLTAGALAGIIGIVVGVVAALALIGIGLVIAYQKVDWFRNMVDSAWAKIKSYFAIAMTFIKGIVTSGMGAVSSFFGEQLAKIRAFWDENGAAIMKVVKFAMSYIGSMIKVQMAIIKGIFQAVWPIIKNTVILTWNVIKGVISSVLDFILGMIRFWTKLLTGDWKGAFASLKDTAKRIMGNIVGIFKGINLYRIGKDIIRGLINGIGSMGSAVWRAAKNIASSVKNAITDFLGVSSPAKELIKVGKWTGEGMAIGLDKSLGMVTKASDAIAGSINPVVSPTINSEPIVRSRESNNYPQGNQVIILEIDGRQFAKAQLPYFEKEIRLKTGTR